MLTSEILLEIFKKVSLYDLSDSTFEYGDEDGEMYINALKGTGSVFDAIKYDGNLFWMMNNGGDFSLLNPMIDAFRILIPHLDDQEYTDGMNNAMFCVTCQALTQYDCFCDEKEYCSCGEPHPYHTDECLFKFKDEDDE